MSGCLRFIFWHQQYRSCDIMKLFGLHKHSPSMAHGMLLPCGWGKAHFCVIWLHVDADRLSAVRVVEHAVAG